jgi:hypothetical protein
MKLRLLEEVSRVDNLFHVNRPGMDWASFAGIMAAESILEGHRAQFDRRADPTRRYEEQAATLSGAPSITLQGEPSGAV